MINPTDISCSFKAEITLERGGAVCIPVKFVDVQTQNSKTHLFCIQHIKKCENDIPKENLLSYKSKNSRLSTILLHQSYYTADKIQISYWWALV